MAATRKTSGTDKPRRPPATTPQARENQLIADAYDLAERQIRDGSASSQIITHFLKLGSSRENLEQAKLTNEVDLLKIRSDSITSAKSSEELYTQALNAMRSYSGQEVPDADD